MEGIMYGGASVIFVSTTLGNIYLFGQETLLKKAQNRVANTFKIGDIWPLITGVNLPPLDSYKPLLSLWTNQNRC